MDAILVTKVKSLTDLSDDELEYRLRQMTDSGHIIFSYEDILKELNRRSQDRHTRSVEKLTKWAVIFAAVATIGTLVSAAAAVISLFKV